MSLPRQTAPSDKPQVGGVTPLWQPHGVPDARFWFSDREIGGQHALPAPYTADDFRRELTRVQRAYRLLAFVAIVLALVAVAAIVGILLQAGWEAR